jgi:hypothetical protein
VPSRREADQDVTLTPLDIVAQNGQQPGFLGHTGLARDAGTQRRSRVPVYHMGPPLEMDGGMTADVVGSAALSVGEVARIRDFVARHAGEHAAATRTFRSLLQQRNVPELMDFLPQLYCIYPHQEPFYEADGRYPRMRFSCAGFVFEAYREARIPLFDESHLPPIDLAGIKKAYPRFVKYLDDQGFRESMGLKSGDKWPVMLCGYLLQATKRENAAIRQREYSPKDGDENFIA